MVTNKRARDGEGPCASKRQRQDTGHDALRAFLERHVTCYGRDKEMDNHAFTMSRVLHHDPDKEWGLFYTFDMATGQGTFDWWRSHYALGTRLIGFGQDHHPMCDGRAMPRQKPHSWIGRILHECSCPLKPFTRMQEWRVSPPTLRVRVGDGEEVWRGKPLGSEKTV